MESIDHIILIGAVVMSLGIVLGAFSARLGVPFLLVFLAVGMLAGVDGPGGIRFSDTWLSFLVGNLALAVILLDGGLRTRFATFRVALKPSLSLATVGVLVTAALVGVFAAWLLGIDWRLGLLLGAIVGSTDAAAVFSMLNSSGIRLKERVASVLEIESGINDPMAIFLTLTLIEWLTAPDGLTPLGLVTRLLVQFGVGGVLGLALGYCLARVLERIRVAEGLQAILLCSGGAMVFALVQSAGGSGFLAVYLTGMLIGNRERAVTPDTMRAMDGMAWLAQSAMFLLLGLLVSPHRIWEVAGPAVAVAAFLMLVARPVAVWLALLPFRFNARETGFIAWMGLRGAVPIVLALFPLLREVPQSGLLFRIAFAVVLASLLFQGTTVSVAARLARVRRPGYPEPLARSRLRGTRAPILEVMQFEVGPNAPVENVRADQLELPPRCRLLTVARDDALAALDQTVLRAGDSVSVLAPVTTLPMLSALFQAPGRAPTWEQASHDFLLSGDALLRDVAALYGTRALTPEEEPLTLESAMQRAFTSPPVEGDSVAIAGLPLTVTRMEGAQILQVGLLLPRLDGDSGGRLWPRRRKEGAERGGEGAEAE
ncbi:potassium/proton antiporter [Cupriavidus necator]|uniref:NhaP-type Na+/H+ and K+/H+ antiporters with a unique C-terminal domain n=1 Tax=Cupriavidus necator (strain ATCC 17699 / DSM 428 / KCTC 22496 / NCIMB 10442 / H16 / Stanier 337) TaxID=381666 RepID=Q0K819_CUPNH|nr:potassium/proton antiporter [Cupriavidus necator]QCC01628.1 potassium/proton antiporter [Cupriavidus necator H16]QQB75541.1 potassium/proton antiporter [Cupriavidus necator]WKA40022.1 potassium/proton antiporter [Cupriavidus necator]CAJ93852.1 NhaP-type Na+/H+ and K+/H+ antiporters with a unique C-terminal domain [Cupriavidus necator H16]